MSSLPWRYGLLISAIAFTKQLLLQANTEVNEKKKV